MTTAQQTLPAPYPLSWPPGRARTPAAKRDRSKRYQLTGYPDAIATVEKEVARWQKAGRSTRLVDWELTSNHIGRPTRELDDVGAALWFVLSGRDVTGDSALLVLSCDRFADLPQNVRAISLTMERLRLVDEIGAYSLVSAVEGARALPPPRGAVALPDRPWRDVLGMGPTTTLIAAEAVYRSLAREAGEGNPKLVELNLAIEAARRELGR